MHNTAHTHQRGDSTGVYTRAGAGRVHLPRVSGEAYNTLCGVPGYPGGIYTGVQEGLEEPLRLFSGRSRGASKTVLEAKAGGTTLFWEAKAGETTLF